MQLKKIIVTLFIILFFSLRLSAQITIIYEEFGIKVYPKRCTDTLSFSYIKNYPACSMKLFLQDCSGKALFELYDKKGNLKIKGEFSSGKDTLLKYSFSEIIGNADEKSHTRVTLIKYLYPLKNNTWFYYDRKHNIVRKEEYEYSFE